MSCRHLRSIVSRIGFSFFFVLYLFTWTDIAVPPKAILTTWLALLHVCEYCLTHCRFVGYILLVILPPFNQFSSDRRATNFRRTWKGEFSKNRSFGTIPESGKCLGIQLRFDSP